MKNGGLRKTIFFLLTLICTSKNIPAQWSGSAELLLAGSLYFNKEEIHIAPRYPDSGFRIGISNFRYESPLLYGLSYMHLFSNTDSAFVKYSRNNQSTGDSLLPGTVAVKYNNIIPKFGFKFNTEKNPLFSFGFTIGIGLAWARAEYDFPSYDPSTMDYWNPVWNQTGMFNDEEKLVSIRPCMELSFYEYYEFRYFYAYACASIDYSMGEFPPTPVSLSAGVIIPFTRKE